VASQPLGELGSSESEPVCFEWRWHYHVPSLPLWGLIGLLLVVPKANRRLQAWLILLPLGLVLLVWRMPLALLGAQPASAEEIISFFVVSLAMGWSAVWLLGHWLGVRSRLLTLLLILAVMGPTGVLSYCCLIEDSTYLTPLVIYFGLSSCTLALAMLLTGWCCRRSCSLLRFLLWLAVWLGVCALVLVFGLLLVAAAFGGPKSLLEFLGVFGGMSAFLAVTLYLLDLPFLILAFNNPFYRQRLRQLFHRTSDIVVEQEAAQPSSAALQ
jgi:hypothetical protein